MFAADEIDMLLKNNLIEPAVSPWAFPLVIAKRRIDGKIVRRMCIDYRKFNDATEGDAFPMQSVDSILR